MIWTRSSANSAVILFFGLAALLLIVVTPLAGLYLERPKASATESDLLVVLGGGFGDRIVEGVKLFRLGMARNVLITGAYSSINKEGLIFIDPRASQFSKAGAGSDFIFLDGSARSTWAEVHVIRALMLKHQWRTVLVVSDPPHLARLQWSLDRVISGYGLAYRLVSSEAEWWHPLLWWTNRIASKFVGKELVKNVYYRIRYGLG